MTQFATDFSEYEVGSPPDDWTPEIDINATIVEGNYLQITPDERWQSIVWDTVGSVSGITEVVAKLRCSEGLGFRMGAGPHLNNAGGVFNLYMASLGQNTERQIITGVSTELAAGTFSDFRNVWVWIRFRVDADGNFSAWFWDDGSTPKTNADSTDLTATNTSFTSGNVGISMDSNNLGVTVLQVGFFGVGTNGDSAPITIASPAAAAPIVPLGRGPRIVIS